MNFHVLFCMREAALPSRSSNRPSYCTFSRDVHMLLDTEEVLWRRQRSLIMQFR